VFEKDLNEDLIETNPALFTELSKGQNFSIRTLAFWGLASLYHSIVIFFFTSSNFPREDMKGAKTDGIWPQGTLTMSIVISVVLLKNGFHTRYWTWIPIAALCGTYAFYYAFICFYSSFPIFLGSGNYTDAAFILLSSGKYYLWLLLFALGVMAIDLSFLFVGRRIFPEVRDVIQQANIKATRPTSPNTEPRQVAAAATSGYTV